MPRSHMRAHAGTMPKLVRPADQPAELETAIAVYGNRARLAILRYLAHHGPALRADIAEATGTVTPTLGAHLVELEKAGAVNVDLPVEKRRGRAVYYTIDPHTLRHLLSVMQGYVFASS